MFPQGLRLEQVALVYDVLPLAHAVPVDWQSPLGEGPPWHHWHERELAAHVLQGPMPRHMSAGPVQPPTVDELGCEQPLG